MTDKTTKRSGINFRLCGAVFFSLFIFTQCARDDSVPYRQAAVVVTPPVQQQVPQQKYQPQYQYQQYQQQYQQYQPTQYYAVPNSRAYSNPYDFAPPYGQSPKSDNDETYELPNDYQLR